MSYMEKGGHCKIEHGDQKGGKDERGEGRRGETRTAPGEERVEKKNMRDE